VVEGVRRESGLDFDAAQGFGWQAQDEGMVAPDPEQVPVVEAEDG